MKKKKNRKLGKFPADVARFFNPHKSGTNAMYHPTTRTLIRPGTHQREKMREKSGNIVVTHEK